MQSDIYLIQVNYNSLYLSIASIRGQPDPAVVITYCVKIKFLLRSLGCGPEKNPAIYQTV